MKAIFNQGEARELRAFVEQGGLLIRIPNNHKHQAQVLKEDGNGCFKTIGVLGEEVSLKLFELYCDPTPMGYHLIGLKECIENFC